MLYDDEPSPLRLFNVKVRTLAEEQIDYEYDGLFCSSIDAVLDAQEKTYPENCKVDVREIK